MDINNQILNAISDLGVIRRLIDTNESQKVSPSAKSANIVVLSGLLFLSSLALVYEQFISNAQIDHLLLFTRTDEELKYGSIFYMGYALLIILIAMYFVIWRSAKHDKVELNSFIAKNFVYLSNLSLVSDLFMKFTTISLVIASGAPKWVAPLLVLFTGDYLIQGRLFKFSLKTMLVLGSLCIAIACGIAYFGITSFTIPLAIFVALVGTSLINVLNAR